MLKAARDAEKFGDKAVAEAIKKEAQGYSCAPKFYKKQCYHELEDITLERCRQSSSLEELLEKYEVAEEFVRRDNGLSREEFREWLPKARRVFEKEARDAWKMSEINQRLSLKMRQ